MIRTISRSDNGPRFEPTADICDAYPSARIVPLELRSFGGNSSCCGRVKTIETQDDNSVVKNLLRQSGDGQVLVIDTRGSLDCAMIGGNLGRFAANNNWAGIIVNGAVRDSLELKATPIAIFALGTCPRRSVNYGIGKTGMAVELGGVIVREDDIVFADEDGVVVLAPWEFGA